MKNVILTLLILCSCSIFAQDMEAVPDQKVYKASKLDKQPEFPCGVSAFYKFVQSNIRTPEIDKVLTVKVELAFVIERDGSISNIRVVKDPGYGFAEASVKALQLLKQKWQPGSKDGQAVRSEFKLPITLSVHS